MDEDEITLMPGSASGAGGSDSGPDASDIAAVLWVPDIEQRHGWREFYVHKAKPDRKPGAFGFRRAEP